MDTKQELKIAGIMAGVFLAAYFLPVGSDRFDNAILEGFYLLREYARLHVITCLVPAFFIAGAVTVFLSSEAVMKYLGAGAKKVVSYGVASVSGSFLAVCSCTILPMFAGIYRVGAGLGPATTFLYAGPAINILAIVLTLRVLGLEIGLARAVGAVVFSVVIGLFMHLIYRNEEREKAAAQANLPPAHVTRPLWQNALFFVALLIILVFANWGAPRGGSVVWEAIYNAKWIVTAIGGLALAVMLVMWFGVRWWKVGLGVVGTAAAALFFPGLPVVPFAAGMAALGVVTATDPIEDGETRQWFESTWDFAKQILPLLFIGVFVAGILLGRPGHEGIIPSAWISAALGGNSLAANLFASVAGAFMYFATLTEVPILQGLLGAGMGKGPALALLLAGPALSLPNMLVIKSVMGAKKTLVYILLVVVMSTAAGTFYGAIF
ncbi:MAG: permease [Deltaproteobacteria bacterium]|nr:permease [Candidatus Zymogenaceae bacterium]